MDVYAIVLKKEDTFYRFHPKVYKKLYHAKRKMDELNAGRSSDINWEVVKSMGWKDAKQNEEWRE